MQKENIKVGGYYKAMVSNKIATVRVDNVEVYEGFKGASGTRLRKMTRYACTNMVTMRKITVKSAAKFRVEVPASVVLKITPPSEVKISLVDHRDINSGSSLGEHLESKEETVTCPDCGHEFEDYEAFEHKCSECSHKWIDRVGSVDGMKDGKIVEFKTVGSVCGLCSQPNHIGLTCSQAKDKREGKKNLNPTISPVSSAMLLPLKENPSAPMSVEIDTSTFRKLPGKAVKRGIPKKDKEEGKENANPTLVVPVTLVSEIATSTVGLTDQNGEREEKSDTHTEGRKLPGSAAKKGKPSLSSLLQKDRVENTPKLDFAPHLVVIARAGTGKTTTLIEGLKLVKGMTSKLVPSPQQKAVWDSLLLSKSSVRSVCFVAFNKAIAEELKGKVPPGCDAMTMHSMGFKAVMKAYPGVKVESYRTSNLIGELLGKDTRELRKEKPVVISAVEKLVSLCKMNLVVLDVVDPSDIQAVEMELQDLCDYYEVELRDETTGKSVRPEVFDLVLRVMERARDVNKDKTVDFNDMIWIPVVMSLPLFRYDLLLIDEGQDLNRCQQELARRAGNRLVVCGDDKQAIYGFSGADSESIPRMQSQLSARPGMKDRGCLTLPLTVTRRCGKAIVEEAKKIVPDFEAHEANNAGVIRNALYPIQGGGRNQRGEQQPTREVPFEENYLSQVKPGDFVLCRCNAPLVSQYFRMVTRGMRARIQGRDIGAGIIAMIRKLAPKDERTWGTPQSLIILLTRLEDWLLNESAKENAKKNPSEAKLIMLQDKYECILTFAQNTPDVGSMIRRVETVFSDDASKSVVENGSKDDPLPSYVCLSSIHKAKGLEAKRVFFLQPKGAECPHPMAKSEWQRGQEMNLRYVATTRAIEELIHVT